MLFVKQEKAWPRSGYILLRQVHKIIKENKGLQAYFKKDKDQNEVLPCSYKIELFLSAINMSICDAHFEHG